MIMLGRHHPSHFLTQPCHKPTDNGLRYDRYFWETVDTGLLMEPRLQCHLVIRQYLTLTSPSPMLLEAASAKPSRAALAFRYFAGGVRELASSIN